MATESNNIQTNTFTGGMNSDSSYDLIKSDQYIFGLNIRITTNALLNATGDSNTAEGIIAPVYKGKVITPLIQLNTTTFNVEYGSQWESPYIILNVGDTLCLYGDNWISAGIEIPCYVYDSNNTQIGQVDGFIDANTTNKEDNVVSLTSEMLGGNSSITCKLSFLMSALPCIDDGVLEITSNSSQWWNNITTKHHSILATASIEDVGAVIMSYYHTDEEDPYYTWVVYRVDLKEYKFYKEFESEHISIDDFDNVKDRFSVVINREIESVVKLYIADGVHQLMQINLLDDDYNTEKILGYSGDYDKTDLITSNRIYPCILTNIVKQISGTLKTSQVQYTYRFYKKYGIVSKLAPVTPKILIIDNNRNKEEGNAEDTTTSLGLLIKIPTSDLSKNFGFPADIFDHILVFRLTYLKAQEDATVDLIYDALIKNEDLLINDNGIKSLQEYSIDEFSALNLLILVPQNIEHNQNYLFASNVEDKTILRDTISGIDSKAYQRNLANAFPLKLNTNVEAEGYRSFESIDAIKEAGDEWDVNPGSIMTLNNDGTSSGEYCVYDNGYYRGGEGTCINYKLVTTDIIIHDLFNETVPNPPYTSKNLLHCPLYYIDNNGNKQESAYRTETYLENHNITACNSLDYNDVIASSMFRSLRRDEVYRYGIIYYNKYGDRSDVQWIGDVKTPTCLQCNNTYGKSDGASSVSTASLDISNAFMLRPQRRVLRTGVIITGATYGFKTISSATQMCISDSTICLKIKSISVGKGNFVKINSTFKDLLAEYSSNPSLSFDYNVYIKIDNTYIAPGVNVEVKAGLTYQIVFERVSCTCNGNRVDTGATGGYGTDNVLDITNWDEFPSAIYTVNGLYANRTEKYGTYDYEGYYDISVSYEIYTYSKELDLTLLYSCPIGIQFDVSIPKSSEITSYLIVRCSKNSEYSKNIMQCALSRPMNQSYSSAGTSTGLKSPYYPTPFLSTQYFKTFDYLQEDCGNYNNNKVFLLNSSEISIFPEDSLSLILENDTSLKPTSFNYQNSLSAISYALCGYTEYSPNLIEANDDILYYNRHITYGSKGSDALDFKSGCTCNLYLYKTIYDKHKYNSSNKDDGLNDNEIPIEAVSSVLVPTWELGFSNIQLNGSELIAGVKAYKSYASSIKTDEYINWVCNGMYNLRMCKSESQYGLNDNTDDNRTKAFTYLKTDDKDVEERSDRASGIIGPGPQCILVRTSDPTSADYNATSFCNSITGYDEDGNLMALTLGTLICNIQHTPQLFAGFSSQEKQFDIYYGFGNFGILTEDENDPTKMSGSLIIFDGDVYTVPCELMSMYKTYNFNSIKDTLPSAQVVNYVPLETKINTFFDYGMTYLNTLSKNLQVEAGEIAGVCSQDRPHHQYNSVYSDNNISNDVYNAQSEENSVNKYTQRIFYSLLKTNGESVDSWSDFRSLNYIDADTRYGEITNLLTDKDVLYFWLVNAFGKLSVNERSLITDNNNNTIQLGQGGVLQRTDYIDTYYGMRKDDLSATNTSSGIFWIDTLNKAILNYTKDKVVNYGEYVNIQNVINERFDSSKHPAIDYDVQNAELVCNCLKDNDQLVFNTKYGCATGIYTRRYDDAIWYNNIIFGLYYENGIEVLKQYNYLAKDTDLSYLTPTVFKFVVNQNASVTKVFDNQLINTMNRAYSDTFALDFMKNKVLKFSTNLNSSSSYSGTTSLVVTDREGNVCYTIPRIDNSEYGNRLRGRWMTVEMKDNAPSADYAISHVLTKFRQSFN